MFKAGDIVRYADGWCREEEKAYRLIVVEWFDDVKRGYVVNPKDRHFCGFGKEAVTEEMITLGTADDAISVLRYLHENNISFN